MTGIDKKKKNPMRMQNYFLITVFETDRSVDIAVISKEGESIMSYNGKINWKYS